MLQEPVERAPEPQTRKYVTFVRNPLRWAVLRLGVTELRGTSPYNYGSKSRYADGAFACGYCGNPLFDGTAKYDSGSGWPSFWRSASDGAVRYQREMDGRLCGKCGRYGSASSYRSTKYGEPHCTI
jgi:peptide-methionine (R)-S-oxide reductase